MLIPPSHRRSVAAVLMLATLVVTVLVANGQWNRHLQEAAEYRSYERREVQESLSGLHRELAMVNLLMGGGNPGAVADYLMARRQEFAPVRWLGYVPAAEEPPRMLLGSAVMAQFDHRQDPALTAVLNHMAENNPAAGVPDTYGDVASLALALPAPGGKGAALVALVDMDDLLRETLRNIDHPPLRFEFTLNGTTLGQWPPGSRHDSDRPHIAMPLSVGTAHFVMVFRNPGWLDEAGALSILPLTVLFAGLSLTTAWLLGSRRPLAAAKLTTPTSPPPAAQIDLRVARMGRLWQMGEMTASLGHDFGQPLNIIRLTAEAALDTLNHNRADPDRIRRSLNTAIDQARRMQSMIDARLAGTRRPQEPPQAVQPVAVMRRALSLVLPRLRAQSIRLTWHADLATPLVTGHGVRLEMAITNVLVNAADALAARTLAGNTAEPAVLRVACRGDGGGILITVEDNGPGFPPGLRTTLALPQGGNGIGLTVALGIVAEMGGSMDFEDAAPGTRVTIRLPAATGGRSVLVVDDEAEAAREIGDYLAGQGWQVRLAGGGREAARLFDQAPCHAVVTDLNMADGDGWHLIETLHARAPDLVIMAVTTAQGEDARRAVTAGAVMVLRKPVGLEQIAQELDELVAG